MDDEKTVVLPDRVFLETKCRELYPIGNAWYNLAYSLAKDSGQEVTAEGIVNWIFHRFTEESMAWTLSIVYKKVICALIEDEEVAEAAVAIFRERLESVEAEEEE